ncbi:hypothetical protein HPB50_028257 [Hyalomma asiaticum]|nr:hypothetical protein HPB50_028257 [Hyalomma asiaticum]
MVSIASTGSGYIATPNDSCRCWLHEAEITALKILFPMAQAQEQKEVLVHAVQTPGPEDQPMGGPRQRHYSGLAHPRRQKTWSVCAGRWETGRNREGTASTGVLLVILAQKNLRQATSRCKSRKIDNCTHRVVERTPAFVGPLVSAVDGSKTRSILFCSSLRW